MTTPTGSATSAMLTGSFRDRAEVERAYNSLPERGYTRDEREWSGFRSEHVQH